jgi:hypothetical protein
MEKLNINSFEAFFYNYKGQKVYFENCRNYADYKSYTLKVFSLLLWLVWTKDKGFKFLWGLK